MRERVERRHRERAKAPPALSKKKPFQLFMKAQVAERAKMERKSGGRSLCWAFYTHSLFTKVAVTDDELRLRDVI